MDNVRITVAVPSAEAAEKIKAALIRNGYDVADVFTSSSEMLRRASFSRPDILIINFDMPDITGLEAARIVGEEGICSIILFVSGMQRELCIGHIEDYDITMFLKPVNPMALISTIDTVIQSRNRIKRLHSELSELKNDMQERKLVERAKGILMKKKNITEDEAYRSIQKMSMDSRVSMKDIAQKIIELAAKK